MATHRPGWIRARAAEYAQSGKAWSDFYKTLQKDEQTIFLKALAKETVKLNKECK